LTQCKASTRFVSWKWKQPSIFKTCYTRFCR